MYIATKKELDLLFLIEVTHLSEYILMREITLFKSRLHDIAIEIEKMCRIYRRTMYRCHSTYYIMKSFTTTKPKTIVIQLLPN